LRRYSKVGEPDNRTAHFFIAKWWAEAVSRNFPAFKILAEDLTAAEDTILAAGTS
jgi:aconitate hydratase